MTNANLKQKTDRLAEILKPLGRVAVAFSAGVDSTFILKFAADTLGAENVVAVTAKSDSLAAAEFEQTVELAGLVGVEHVVIETDEFDDPDYLANPVNRCYFCKTSLYNHMTDFCTSRDIPAAINGINADDLGDYRPGIQAAREHNVLTPAADAGLTKDDIRQLSEQMNLPTFDKPASPCLSSRVQYGENITPEKLRMIESCESFLHELGFRECRVRHHNNLARIEVPADRIGELLDPELRTKIDQHFRDAGYKYVTIDLKGFRSGSMNEVIAFGQVQTSL